MGFFIWHYSEGINFYLRRWWFYLRWIIHYFSLPLLLKSLFAPWKRLVIEEEVGFNLEKIFQKLTFNLVSRGIGAGVRTFLFIFGLLVFLLAALLGFLGFLVWAILPLLSLPVYWQQKQRTEEFLEGLMAQIKAKPEEAVSLLFKNEAGELTLSHVGTNLSAFGENLKLKNSSLENLKAVTYKELMNWFINAFSLDEEFFRQKGFSAQDLVLAARWWDEKKAHQYQVKDEEMGFGRPGIGLELLFGYTPQLNQYVIDLGTPQAFSHHLIGREQIVSRIERILTSGDSVFLVGQPGVGKKTVVLEFAHRAASGQLGPQMAYRRVLEFDYNFLLAEASDLNLKKAKLASLLGEACRAGNIILVIRDIHRLTNAEVEDHDFSDIFEQFLEKGELKIIAIASSADYERFITPNLRLSKYFQTVEAVSPTNEEAMSILMVKAEDWETQKKMVVLVSALRRILEGSDRYITETPFPEKALELLDEAVAYGERKGGKVLTVAEVDTVLSEKTGISFTQLTEPIKKQLSHLEEIIHERLVNQEMAVSLIAKSLRGRSLGVREEDRPIGSFLFLGPTGVGKTETAKVLARVYYGSEKNLLRLDMAEYAGSEGLSRLIGSLSQNQPGMLTTAIKNRPASLLLLDEIEKAPAEVFNLFLALFDEGMITDAFNRKINCRNLFVIATANAGAEYVRELVNQGVVGEKLQEAVVDYIQKEGFFSPEFLNRFDGVVVFEPLRKEDLVKIAHLLLEDFQKSLKSKNVYLEITPAACQKLAEDGYEPAFGARPMRRIVDLVIGDLLGKGILKGEIKEGDRIKIIPGKNKEEYHWAKV